MAIQPAHTHCQNCGATLEGAFCHRCGQHDFDATRSFHHVFFEALETLFHFDEKLFRNVITLLGRPGVLSADYNAGKRVSQVPPFRLYLFVSVLFFFVSFLAGNMPIRLAESETPAERSAAGENTGAARDKKAPAVHATKTPGGEKAGEGGRLGQFLHGKWEYLAGHQREVTEELAHAFPKILILCLPIFALFTRFLFAKAGQTYLQHLIVAVHFHTFIFLWKMITDGWLEVLKLGSTRAADVAAVSVAAWFILYPLLMFRRLYGEPWLKTIAKSVALFVAYELALLIGFLAAFSILFLFG